MRPIALKGHERPITFLKYNREGDILFSCAKDNKPTAWWSENGERVGTYIGHNGAVYCCDIDWYTTKLITASADNTAKLWDAQYGRELASLQYTTPVRSIAYSMGDKMFAVATNQFMDTKSTIRIYASETMGATDKPLVEINAPHDGNVNQVLWGPVNKYILSCGDDGYLKAWDPSTGQLLHTVQDHKKGINSFAFAKDLTNFITASADNTSKLFDSKTFKCLKTYTTDRPVNTAAISPLMDHVLVAGGQEASQVTTTSSRMGKFESRLYHKIFEEDLAGIRGHFGPVNYVAFHPDGKSFTSGGEDGYVRVHFFDPEYFTEKFA